MRLFEVIYASLWGDCGHIRDRGAAVVAQRSWGVSITTLPGGRGVACVGESEFSVIAFGARWMQSFLFEYLLHYWAWAATISTACVSDCAGLNYPEGLFGTTQEAQIQSYTWRLYFGNTIGIVHSHRPRCEMLVLEGWFRTPAKPPAR